jgi:hypothetical protein
MINGLASLATPDILLAMEDVNPAAEWLRLAERYRHMADGEILILARQSDQRATGSAPLHDSNGSAVAAATSGKMTG